MKSCSSWAWVSLLISVLLAACGGGGGGGSAGPANVVETDPEPEQLKAGLFTDAPVTGLRYVQGHREGYTENGVFQYDANHSDPICFYIGNVLLGCARGGEIITPYDLSSAGSPAGLQSGYNISRLLISLDGSSDAGIQLPEATRIAQGGIDFFLSDGMFATDEVVEELIAKYSPQGSLVSREGVDAHVADNADVQEAIRNLTQTLSQAISGIKITWDTSLNGKGVLAHVEASSAGLPSSFEHLYLELDAVEGDLFLSQVTYANTSGDYSSVKINSHGIPINVYQDVKAYTFLNVLNSSLEDWIVTSSYQPQKSGYIIDSQGYTARKEARYMAESRSRELVEIVDRVQVNGITDEEMLRLSASAAAMINSVQCAGENIGTCSTYLEEALVYALADETFAQSTIDWNYSSLSYDLCLPLNIGVSGQDCGVAPNLDQFNVVVSQAIQALQSQPEWVQSLDEWDSYAAMVLSYPSGDYYLNYVKICLVEGGLKALGDGSYYNYFHKKPGTCQLPYDDETGAFGEGCSVYPFSSTYDPDRCDIHSLARPSDWEKQKALAEKIFDRYLNDGVGMRMVEVNTTNILTTYVTEDEVIHQNDSVWYESISDPDRILDSEFYFDYLAPIIDGEIEHGFVWTSLKIPVNTSSNILATQFVHSKGLYRDNTGTEVSLAIVGDMRFHRDN